MSTEVFIRQKAVVDSDDKVFTGSATANTNGTKLTCSDSSRTHIITRTGRKARLVFVSNDAGSGGDAYLTFHIYVNGNPIQSAPYNSFSLSVGETYNPSGRMSVPVDLPQGALIEVLVDNSDAANAYTATVRLRVEYEDFN